MAKDFLSLEYGKEGEVNGASYSKSPSWTIYSTIYGNGKTNGVLPSFLDWELVTEFESWELHDEDLSLVLSVHLLALMIFIWDAIETNNMLDDNKSIEVVITR